MTDTATRDRDGGLGEQNQSLQLSRRDVLERAGAVGLVVATSGLLATRGAFAASATAGSEAEQVAAARTTVVRITLGTKANNFVLVPSIRTVRAGKVTFVVHNGGTMEHEFVVLRTNIPAGKLPMRPGGKQAKEVGALGEIKEFKPGMTKRLTLTLKPGRHVLLCNLPGHYKAGQFSGLAVR